MLRPFEKCYSLLTKDFFTQEVLPSMTLIKLNRQTSWDKVGQQPTGLFNYMKSSSPRYYNHLHHHYPCHQRHFHRHHNHLRYHYYHLHHQHIRHCHHNFHHHHFPYHCRHFHRHRHSHNSEFNFQVVLSFSVSNL